MKADLSRDAAAAATTEDESELIVRLRAGEDAAFETLVRTQGGRMLAVARRYLSEDDAQDAVQDAFVSVTRAIEKFEGNSRLSTWLHRIAINACLMKLRTRRRKPEEKIDDLLPGFLENGNLAEMPPPWRDSADKLLERDENRRLVRAAIDRLPEKYRTVLILRDIEDLDTEQTARALELSVPAVKTRLHRARLALKGLLDHSFATDSPPATRGSEG